MACPLCRERVQILRLWIRSARPAESTGLDSSAMLSRTSSACPLGKTRSSVSVHTTTCCGLCWPSGPVSPPLTGSQVMYWTIDATSRWAVFYYILVIFFGAIFLVDLSIGVVAEAYEDVVEEEDHLEEEKIQSERRRAFKERKSTTPNKSKPNSLSKSSSRSSFRKTDSRSDLEVGKSSPSFILTVGRHSQGGHGQSLWRIKKGIDEEEDGKEHVPLYVAACRGILEGSFFTPCSAVLTVANAVVLAMPYYGMSSTYQKLLDSINLVLTIAFTIEVAIRLLAQGTSKFFKERFNLFDLVRLLCLPRLSICLLFNCPPFYVSRGCALFSTGCVTRA
eukprot:jgi/Botrbrau1/7305/Bobra.247_3s0002.1